MWREKETTGGSVPQHPTHDVYLLGLELPAVAQMPCLRASAISAPDAAVTRPLLKSRTRPLSADFPRLHSEVKSFFRGALDLLILVVVAGLLLLRESCRLLDENLKSGVVGLFTLLVGFLWAVGACLTLGAGAGALYLVVSALLALFTFGLTDEEHAMSAYSVFNAGCRRLLGHVAAEDLVANMVGGIAGAQMRMMEQQRQPQPQEDQRGMGEAWEVEEEEEEEEENKEEGEEVEERRRGEGRRNRKKKGRRSAEEKAEIRRRRERREMRHAQAEWEAMGAPDFED
eukprot:scaffold731_cov261-Pinguiococcus_pyrenoidosus.AAC.72